jgi:hypothetical protein
MTASRHKMLLLSVLLMSSGASYGGGRRISDYVFWSLWRWRRRHSLPSNPIHDVVTENR